MYRFIEIDKLTTASATGGSQSRPYRFGYGVFDKNMNFIKDPDEKKVYFEISDYGYKLRLLRKSLLILRTAKTMRWLPLLLLISCTTNQSDFGSGVAVEAVNEKARK